MGRSKNGAQHKDMRVVLRIDRVGKRDISLQEQESELEKSILEIMPKGWKSATVEGVLRVGPGASAQGPYAQFMHEKIAEIKNRDLRKDNPEKKKKHKQAFQEASPGPTKRRRFRVF